MINRYTLVKLGKTQFDLFEKINDNSFKSLETGIVYNTGIDLEEYIKTKMNLEILISSDDLVEISERIKQHDTKGIQYRFAKYLK